MTSSYPMMSSIFFFQSRGEEISNFPVLLLDFFFPHILEFLDFSHVGTIYGGKNQNHEGHRRNSSTEKKFFHCTWEKEKILRKNGKVKNFTQTPLTFLLKIFFFSSNNNTTTLSKQHNVIPFLSCKNQ